MILPSRSRLLFVTFSNLKCYLAFTSICVCFFLQLCIDLHSDLCSNLGLIVLVSLFLSIHKMLLQQTTSAVQKIDSRFAIYCVNFTLGEMCDLCTENSTFIYSLLDNWNMQTSIGYDCVVQSNPMKWEQIRRETRSNKNEIETIFARRALSQRNRNRNLVRGKMFRSFLSITIECVIISVLPTFSCYQFVKLLTRRWI